VGVNGAALAYASEDLQSDREVVLAAVAQDGLALQHASRHFASDREVVLVAVRSCGLALQFASREYLEDKEIVLAAVRQNGLALNFAGPGVSADRSVVQQALLQNEWTLQFASDEVRSDADFVFEALQRNPNSFGGASLELRSDKMMALRALRLQPNTAIFVVPRTLPQDPDFQAAVASHLASPGDEVPVLSISVEFVSGQFLLQGTSMSGVIYEATSQEEASVADVAASIWRAWKQKATQATTKYLHLVLHGADRCLSPLDASKPFRDFFVLPVEE